MTSSFIITFLAIAFGLTTANNNQDAKACKATINHTIEDDMNVFQGVLYNHPDDALTGHYTLETIREGPSGRSVSRQGGQFTAGGGSTEKLSRSSVNSHPHDTLKVVLKIFSQDHLLVCCDSIVVTPGL